MADLNFPWECRPSIPEDGSECYWIVGADGCDIGAVDGPQSDKRERYAMLIAAAPELLEALILLEREMVESGNAESVDYGWKPAITKTRAAIAKATGEQP